MVGNDGTGSQIQSQECESPLKGIRFAPMSAPGPGGARPEHTRELLSIRRRSIANRYLRYLAKLIDAALAGSLRIARGGY